MTESASIFTTEVGAAPALDRRIGAFLQAHGLHPDDDLELFAVALAPGDDDVVVGCAGIAGHVVKCVCVADAWKGTSLSLQIGMVLLRWAGRAGREHLFLFTRPANVRIFRGWGFYPVVEVPGQVACLENSSHAVRDYSAGLGLHRIDGRRIGGIVMNANPFTLGHQALVQEALKLCDWVHVFVVKEDASEISYADRLSMVVQGLAGLGHVTVHPGSDYVLSRATFPGYFLHDKKDVDHGWAVIDILIFRKYIAPALGITDRFVGEEPSDLTTRQYNAELARWLTTTDAEDPPLQLHVVPRLMIDGQTLSASRVRLGLRSSDFESISHLVPATTLQFLKSKYPSGIH